MKGLRAHTTRRYDLLKLTNASAVIMINAEAADFEQLHVPHTGGNLHVLSHYALVIFLLSTTH